MGRTVKQAVFELLHALPEVEEVVSHGAPTFKAGGKTFATWTANHHCDGRLALWLAMDPESQAHIVAGNPEVYFVPPYVGVKGWVGMDLARDLSWQEVCDRALQSWAYAAPAKLQSRHPGTVSVPPPTEAVRPEDINPMLGERAQTVLRGLSEHCRKLPEAEPEDEHASPTWRAGKKVFLRGHHDDRERLKLLFLVGAEQQAMMLDDPRYALPLYWGPNGWIELDVEDDIVWPEVASLIETSYRNVALKRMLKALDEA